MESQSLAPSTVIQSCAIIKQYPITLAQIYHQLAKDLCKDILTIIFSFQLKIDGIDLNDFLSSLTDYCEDTESLVRFIETSLHLCDFILTSNLIEQFFPLTHIRSICDIKYKDDSLKSCLHYAMESEWATHLAHILIKINGNNVSKLLTMKDKHNQTPLHYAAYYGDTETVKLFLNSIRNNVWTLLSIGNAEGMTALHIAARNSHTEVVKLILNAATNNIWTLLTAKEVNGLTALHIAAHYGNIETVKYLLQGAGNKALTFLSMKGKGSETALEMASENVNSKKELIMKQVIEQSKFL
jgi:hypothetical protein